MGYYDLDELETNLTPDMNCCGYEGDCEGCGHYNNDYRYCNYKPKN